MISATMQEAFNAQIQAELYSSNLYLAMASHCHRKAFKGFGRWLMAQAAEERGHALKLVEHLLDRGGVVEIRALQAPPTDFGTLLETFEAVAKHEAHVTGLVHALYARARSEQDYASQTFLQWYVNEQVQEEADASEIVDKVRMVADRPGSALYLDKEYGKRTS